MDLDVAKIWVFSYMAGEEFVAGLNPDNGIACAAAGRNNDPEAYCRRLVNEEWESVDELAEVQKTLVGNGACAARRNEFVQTMGFEPIDSTA